MLRAAAEAAEAPGSPRLLAVTVLTSMDAEELISVGVSASPAEQALRLARLAEDSGIHGMVCSAEEVGSLRREIGPDALLVVPGIRPSGASLDDQRRIATPGDAISRGSSMLVVGRPITKATNPAAAARAVLEEIASALHPPTSTFGAKSSIHAT
jgi:orotidine-5'-phosphate decarboxylase